MKTFIVTSRAQGIKRLKQETSQGMVDAKAGRVSKIDMDAIKAKGRALNDDGNIFLHHARDVSSRLF